MRTLLTIFILINNSGICQTDFILKGKINSLEGKVQLVPYFNLEHNTPLIIENQVRKGEFIVKGKQDFPKAYTLKFYLGDSLKYNSQIFILENVTQTAEFDVLKNSQSIMNSTMIEIQNSDYYKKIKRFKKDELYFNTISNFNLETRSDSITDAINLMRLNLNERKSAINYDLIGIKRNNYFSFWLLFKDFVDKGFNSNHLFFYNNFSNKLKKSKYGNEFWTRLNESDSVGLGKIFPPFRFLNSTNNKLEAISYKSSKYTFLDFWYSGCGICINQFPELKSISEKIELKSFQIISINADLKDNLKYSNYFRNKFNYKWEEYFDINRENSKRMNLWGYPSNFLINNFGMIIRKNIKPEELMKFLLEANL